jgi:hypothetical protein
VGFNRRQGPVAANYGTVDRVNSQPDGADLPGQPPRQRAFYRSGQAAENDKHEMTSTWVLQLAIRGFLIRIPQGH